MKLSSISSVKNKSIEIKWWQYLNFSLYPPTPDFTNSQSYFFTPRFHQVKMKFWCVSCLGHPEDQLAHRVARLEFGHLMCERIKGARGSWCKRFGMSIGSFWAQFFRKKKKKQHIKSGQFLRVESCRPLGKHLLAQMWTGWTVILLRSLNCHPAGWSSCFYSSHRIKKFCLLLFFPPPPGLICC